MAGSFHEVQFPPSISEGAVGGPRFSTTVTVLSSGAEHRNINWSQARGEWDVAHAVKSSAQINALIAFFRARNGKAYGFRFKDWTDFTLPNWTYTPGDLDPLPTLFTTDGTTATFQLTKVYGDTAASYTRAIYKPVAGTVQIFVNGVATTAYTVDTTTGIVTLNSSVYGTGGRVITGYCTFDTPCRFDTDDMKVSIRSVDNFNWQPIPVVETREIA